MSPPVCSGHGICDPPAGAAVTTAATTAAAGTPPTTGAVTTAAAVAATTTAAAAAAAATVGNPCKCTGAIYVMYMQCLRCMLGWQWDGASGYVDVSAGVPQATSRRRCARGVRTTTTARAAMSCACPSARSFFPLTWRILFVLLRASHEAMPPATKRIDGRIE